MDPRKRKKLNNFIFDLYYLPFTVCQISRKVALSYSLPNFSINCWLMQCESWQKWRQNIVLFLSQLFHLLSDRPDESPEGNVDP